MTLVLIHMEPFSHFQGQLFILKTNVGWCFTLLQNLSTRITCTLTAAESDVNQRHIVCIGEAVNTQTRARVFCYFPTSVPFSFVIFYTFSLTLKTCLLFQLRCVPSALTARFVEDEVI